MVSAVRQIKCEITPKVMFDMDFIEEGYYYFTLRKTRQ